jgi:hypothetical protein
MASLIIGAVLFVLGWLIVNRAWKPDPSWYGLIILIIGLGMVVFGSLTHGARAADLPCPPRHYACWQVRLAVNDFGEPATVAQVKACGWSEARIAEARKCLRP